MIVITLPYEYHFYFVVSGTHMKLTEVKLRQDNSQWVIGLQLYILDELFITKYLAIS